MRLERHKESKASGYTSSESSSIVLGMAICVGGVFKRAQKVEEGELFSGSTGSRQRQ